MGGGASRPPASIFLLREPTGRHPPLRTALSDRRGRQGLRQASRCISRDVGVVAEHGRGLPLDHHSAGHAPGSSTSVRDLIAAIEAFIDGWNDRCHLFTGPRPPTRYFRNTAQVKSSFTRH